MFEALSNDPGAIVSIALRAICLGFALLAAGTVLVNALWLDRDAMIASRSPRTALSACVLAFAAGVVAWIDMSKQLYGSTASAFDPVVIESLLATPPGHFFALLLAGLAWMLFTTLGAGTLPVLAVPGAVAALLSMGLVGHTLHEPRWLLYGLLTVHLTLAAIWMGVLLPLSRLTRLPRNRGHAADLAEDFGQWALMIVPVLVLAAGFLGWQLLGKPTEIPSHGYADLLRVKLALVAFVLLVGACNRFIIVPRLHDSLTAGKWLRATITLEGIGFACIVLTVSAMTYLYHPNPL